MIDTVYIGFQGSWPLYEHSLKHKSHFSVLTQLEINKKYLPKYFPINIEYKFGEKEHLRHFFNTFNFRGTFCDILWITKKMRQKKIQRLSSLNLGFRA